jgi:hypothetical protein
LWRGICTAGPENRWLSEFLEAQAERNLYRSHVDVEKSIKTFYLLIRNVPFNFKNNNAMIMTIEIIINLPIFGAK